MDKQSLVRDMKQSFGGAGLISQTQIAEYRGMKRKSTKAFLEGVEYSTEGKNKLYFVGDVAQRILENRK